MTVHTEQRWSAETERIVAVALEDVQPLESDTSDPDEAFYDDARRILAALADSGLLLPEGGETRTEQGYWNPETQEVQHWWSYHDRGYKAPDRRRTVTTWPDGSQHIGPWEPVQ